MESLSKNTIESIDQLCWDNILDNVSTKDIQSLLCVSKNVNHHARQYIFKRYGRFTIKQHTFIISAEFQPDLHGDLEQQTLKQYTILKILYPYQSDALNQPSVRYITELVRQMSDLEELVICGKICFDIDEILCICQNKIKSISLDQLTDTNEFFIGNGAKWAHTEYPCLQRLKLDRVHKLALNFKRKFPELFVFLAHNPSINKFEVSADIWLSNVSEFLDTKWFVHQLIVNVYVLTQDEFETLRTTIERAFLLKKYKWLKICYKVSSNMRSVSNFSGLMSISVRYRQNYECDNNAMSLMNEMSTVKEMSFHGDYDVTWIDLCPRLEKIFLYITCLTVEEGLELVRLISKKSFDRDVIIYVHEYIYLKIMEKMFMLKSNIILRRILN